MSDNNSPKPLMLCIGCGERITTGGAECLKAPEAEAFVKGKQPHYKDPVLRDTAVLALQEGGIQAWPLGLEAERHPAPYYFIIPEIKEIWKAKIQCGFIPGMVWHFTECFPDGHYCFCDKCAEANNNTCPKCHAPLTPFE